MEAKGFRQLCPMQLMKNDLIVIFVIDKLRGKKVEDKLSGRSSIFRRIDPERLRAPRLSAALQGFGV
jgi:hypothetical protein